MAIVTQISPGHGIQITLKTGRGCIQRQNPLTAKVAKPFRKDLKGMKYNDLALCALQLLCALCG
jgi:hypothetical protein